MTSFKLPSGAEIGVQITVNTLRKLKSELSIDLAKVFETDLLISLYSDPILLCDVLYVCCQPSLDRLKIDDVQFGELLASGDTISAATDAFMEALVLFTPPGSRPAIAKAVTKIREMEKKQTQLAIARIESPAMDQMVQAQHDQIMKQIEQTTQWIPTTHSPHDQSMETKSGSGLTISLDGLEWSQAPTRSAS